MTASTSSCLPSEAPGVANLLDRYMEACEKQGVAPTIEVHNAIAKAKVQHLGGILKFNLEQLTEADMLALAEALSTIENSEWHAVDVVHNKEISYGPLLLRVLRSVGLKLRLVDLKKITFARNVLRDLFHRGLQCQILDLSFCRSRKLDMIGHFPQLHTLILDFNYYLTTLSEGCFRATPNLAKISMCETRIANLWTTCAALSKLPGLVELRFQSCRCCEGTKQCSSTVTNEKTEIEDNSYIRHLGPSIWNMDSARMHLDDFMSQDAEGSDSSTTDGCDDLFSDDDPGMVLHPAHMSSEDSVLDSETELDGNLLETMSVDYDFNYQNDGHIFETSDLVNEQDETEAKEDSSNFVTDLIERDDAERDDFFCLESSNSPSTSENIFSPGRNCPEVSTSGGENLHDETELNFSRSMQRNYFFLRRGRFRHPSRICYEKHYRDFIIARIPGLKVLDNIPVTQAERDTANRVFKDNFEILPYNRSERENIVDVLRGREISSWVSSFASSKRRRIGIAGKGPKEVAFTRSMCALKMSSCAWPLTAPICKDKKSTVEMNRKCRPRQFEYHPTDPALMVFGTLHGEVIVVNHESDKVVGHVQCTGPSHSILGLCWLNKDPTKLIAGSDNGSLQLYDVNRMRGFNSPGRALRNPAIYTYENFEQLTSVHINASDEYFLASGYSRNVGLYDLCTGKQLQIFNDLHQKHINVVKFSHHSPNLFATSSFDKEIKMWDLRQRITRPLYTIRSTGGNVMVCFSRDDYYLLSSAVDNEVKQHLAVDGRLNMKFDIPRSGSAQNYTRSYYMNGRDYIISGSCEENVVRIYSAQTGRRLRDLALQGRGSKNSIYVQSLRGDPFRDFHFSVLAAYFEPHPKSEILKVNLLASNVLKKNSDVDPQHKLPAGMGA